jgi:Coenzyme PQQ synthesis protein D (PqqD)
VTTESTIPDSATVAVAADVLGSELGSEVVMLSLRDGTYYGLEEVGAEIWRLIQAPITLGRIVAALVDAYDVEASRCRADVIRLVAALRDRGLVEVREAG